MTSPKEADYNRSIQDRAYDLLGELIIVRQTERLLKEIEEEKARGDTVQMDAFFAKHDRINLAKIQAYYRKQKIRRFFQETLPKIAQTAAIVIAVLTLTGGVAIATSHTVRVHVMQLLINIEEQYTEIKLVENTAASFDVPAEWRGSRYPSRIPDHLTLSNISTTENVRLVEYADVLTGNIVLRFQEFDESAEANVDTEKAKLTKISVNGQIGYITEKGEAVNVFWSDGHNCFLLTTKGMEPEETLDIAQSVRSTK